MEKIKFHPCVSYEKVGRFDVTRNGIQLIENEDEIRIFNDPFRTIPLFVTRDVYSVLHVFSHFDAYFEIEGLCRDIDPVGFWEIIVFGSSLWTRTLYKGVEQMPSASTLIINKATVEYSIKRYWDFNVPEDVSIDTVEGATEGLYERLDNVFSRLERNQIYHMGMSGGMDSRLSAAFVSKYIPAENIRLFTYGFDDRILEYRYAIEVAEKLGLARPEFHKLGKRSYDDALVELPMLSGGQISHYHCHMYDYMKNHMPSNARHISTYFSDAVLGWDCVHPKKIDSVSNNFYALELRNNDLLAPEIKDAIIGDADFIFKGYCSDSNISSMNEYKYITERNQKFHMYLASVQGRLVRNVFPYANYELFTYALSVPIQFRNRKLLVDNILTKYYFDLSDGQCGNISSRFQWGASYSTKTDWYSFRLLNRVNAVLRKTLKGNFQFFNKYQTEEQDRLLGKCYHEALKEATRQCVNRGLMTIDQKKHYDVLPLKPSGVAERYQIISLSQLL